MLHVLETYPRDELFQASVPELVRTIRGIVNLYERRRVRLFARRDPYQRFFSCLLFVPRDRYNTQARERIERILFEELAGVDLESQVQISESALARLQIMVRTDPSRTVEADVERIEQRITEALRTWADQLREELHQQVAHGRGGCTRGPLPAARSPSRTRTTCGRATPSATCANSRPSRDDPQALGMELRPGDAGAGRAAPAHLSAQRARRDVRHAADARELRPADPQRAALSRERDRRRAALDPGPRGAARGRPHARSRAGRQALRTGVLRRAERPRRERRLQPAGAGGRPRLAPGRRAARHLQVPAADGHPVQPALHGGGAGAQPGHRRAAGVDRSRRASIPT